MTEERTQRAVAAPIDEAAKLDVEAAGRQPPPTPIAVVGLGAVGSLLAGCLAGAGRPVVAVRRGAAPSSLRSIVLVEPDRKRRTVRLTEASPDAIPEACRVAVLAVKQFDLTAALDALAGRPDLVLVTVQNGLGAEEAVLARRPGAGLVAASLTASVERGPGDEIHWLRRGGIGLAAVEGPVDGVVDDLVAAFRAGGLPARRYREWRAMKWSKLLGNLVGNATSAILDLDPAAVYADPRSFDVERAQLEEALAVMARLGLRPVGLPGAPIDWLVRLIRLPPAVARPLLRAVAGSARGGKAPSLRGRVAASGPGPSEVAWLNGAVVERARSVGLEAPVNRRLTALVEEVLADPERRAWFRGRPDRLVAALDG